MGIGPVTGVRPVTMVKPSTTGRDLSGVFAVEFREQDQEEAYSRSHPAAARGLEDEETDDVAEQESLTQESSSDDPHTGIHPKVSFFA